MRVAVVLGTRPEVIKMAPVLRECARRGVQADVLHTGQHYSREMDAVFFEQLGLPEPAANLRVGSGPHGRQTGRMLEGIEAELEARRPDAVLVQGDTNSVLAGGLAAAKLRLRLGHVEAGLRSGDRRMPEEVNRVVVDHLADDLYAPTEDAARNLRAEGVPAERVLVTGNTVVDAVLQNRRLAGERGALAGLGLEQGKYVLVTAHRQENVDDPRAFAGILEGARLAGRDLGLPVVYPIHPRARKMLGALGLDASGLRLLDPLDFLSFLQLEASARLVLTDSGGVQEEACILGVPCVTLRETTERPETLAVGANVLAGADPRRILDAARRMAEARPSWSNPYGDGRASERIVDHLVRT